MPTQKDSRVLAFPQSAQAVPTKFFGTRVKQDLYEEVRAEQIKRGLTFRQVVEWSFTAFLLRAHTVPEHASKAEAEHATALSG